jgi:hypothetical protein
MPTLEQYKRRLKGKNESIKKQRRDAADLNNELAWELADGHQDAMVWTRVETDNNIEEWQDMDILVRHALTGQEKKIITKPNVNLPIGSYVTYNDITCIIRENLLDPQDVMPSYKAFICTTELHLKGCPFVFPVYAFNSSYSSKGLVDYDKLMGLDSRNKLYIQKNKYTVRLYQHHRNYRIAVGDDETQYYYFITEMDDISYPGMFVISLKIDEKHPNDEGFYAFNERVIDFSDLYLTEDDEEPINLPIIHCQSYYEVNEEFTVECNNTIQNVYFEFPWMQVVLKNEKTCVVKATETGLNKITIVDINGNEVSKNIMIK